MRAHSARKRGLAFRFSGRALPAMSEDAWTRCSEGATELACDRLGLRTLRSLDGTLVIKEFGLKRVLSTALLRPYALRFVDNAAELRRLGFMAPDVTGAWRRDAAAVHVILYRWQEGRDLREVSASDDAGPALSALGACLGRLHDRGVDFRSGHLGNYLVDASGRLAIIDCADMRFRHRPLTPRERARALAALLGRDGTDAAVIERHALETCSGYFGAMTASQECIRDTWGLLPRGLTGHEFDLDDIWRPSRAVDELDAPGRV